VDFGGRITGLAPGEHKDGERRDEARRFEWHHKRRIKGMRGQKKAMRRGAAYLAGEKKKTEGKSFDEKKNAKKRVKYLPEKRMRGRRRQGKFWIFVGSHRKEKKYTEK